MGFDKTGQGLTMNDIVRNELGGNNLGLILPAGTYTENHKSNMANPTENGGKVYRMGNGNVLDNETRTKINEEKEKEMILQFEKNKKDDLKKYDNIIKYNELKLKDDIYSKMTLHNGYIIVRMKISEPELLNDFILWEAHKVYVPTKSGMDMETVDNPWPFIKEGVVVNKAKSIESLNVGDKIIVNPSVIEVVPKPGTSYPYIKAMFFMNDSLPKVDDVYNGKIDNFGYFLIRTTDLISTIND